MRINLKFIKNNNGIILLEAIIAVAVIVMIMTALVTALISSLNNTTFSNDQTIATGYAQEGIEIARSEKNYNFGEFQGLDGPYHVGEGQSTIEGGASCYIEDEKYCRTIYVNNDGYDNRLVEAVEKKCEQTNSIFVASTVTWSDSRCNSGARCHKVDLNSCFVNLNFVEAP